MASPARASQFIEETVQRFHSESQTPSRVLDIAIAGHTIRIHVSGEQLWDIIHPALEWQESLSHASVPDIEIFALEGAGVINFPWDYDDAVGAERNDDTRHKNVLATYSSDYLTLSMFDRSTSRGLFWVQSAQDLPEWECGAPLRTLLTWALLDRGLHLVHAAGVGISDTGVMISGPGGAGKSTTTAVCLRAGFLTTGDDYCVVSPTQPPQILSIYGLMKLVPGAVGTASLNGSRLTQPRSDGKVHFDITPSMTKSLTLTALLFTKVGERTSQPVAISSREAFLRLLPSTWAQTSLPQPELFRSLSQLAQSTRSFQVEVGPDIDKIPGIVGNL